MNDVRTLTVYAGARPNAPKLWALLAGLRAHRASPELRWRIVHTGQHHDPLLGPEFCRQLGIPIDHELAVGSAPSDGEQLAALIRAVEDDLVRTRPSAVVVIGDVNTTLAAAVVAARNGYPVIHAEAGLRSRTVTPEEVNRRIITSCATFHLAPSPRACRNLTGEGVPAASVFRIGNLMAECHLGHHEQRAASRVLDELDLRPKDFVLLTVHKPATLDQLSGVLAAVDELSRKHGRIVFPCHPHTARALPAELADRVRDWLVPPQPYAAFSRLLTDSRFVVTDSDGVQEECAVAGVPCLTVAADTARPETVECGSNHLVGTDPELLIKAADSLVDEPPARRPEGWDDQVSTRLAEALEHIVPALPTAGGRSLRVGTEQKGVRG